MGEEAHARATVVYGTRMVPYELHSLRSGRMAAVRRSVPARKAAAGRTAGRARTVGRGGAASRLGVRSGRAHERVGRQRCSSAARTREDRTREYHSLHGIRRKATHRLIDVPNGAKAAVSQASRAAACLSLPCSRESAAERVIPPLCCTHAQLNSRSLADAVVLRVLRVSKELAGAKSVRQLRSFRGVTPALRGMCA